MRDTCDDIHGKKYRQLVDFSVPLCLESHDIYYFNILRMITLLYNLYIEHEIYDISYHKRRNFLNANLFIENIMSQWNDSITFDEEIRKMEF